MHRLPAVRIEQKSGTLCYMVGGSEEALSAASPVFSTSAEKIVHAGLSWVRHCAETVQ